MFRLVVAALGATLLLTASAHAAVEPRPPQGGMAAYTSPSQSYATARTVVHWVTRGTQAPPLNDDDADGVPDYVEAVGAAAELSLTRFAQRGFRVPPSDTGGPDGRIDLYVSELPFGIFGAMLPPDVSRDGSFVIVSSSLDRREPLAIGSLKATVAHEIFHVVQHAYAFGTLPHWLVEGTADALAALAVPEAADVLARLGVDRWIRASGRTAADNDPYGSAPWWTYLERRDPGFVLALLEQRERDGAARAAADPDAYRLLDRLHRTRNGTSVDVPFRRFAAELAAGKTLAKETLVRGEQRVASVPPFAIRAYRFTLVPRRRSVVTVQTRGSSLPDVQLVLRSGRTIVGTNGRLRVAGDLAGATLVLTGRATQTRPAFGRTSELRVRLTIARA